MHAMFGAVNNGKLYLAPISPPIASDSDPGDQQQQQYRILDMGAGTGIWCIDMGDLFPLASILGVDISASAPTFLPPNVRFEIDDLEDPWTYSQPFDYIHGRYLAGSIKDWPGLIRQCLDFLKPGGWLELVDYDIWWYSQDGSLTEDHALRRYMRAAHTTEAISGRSFVPGHNLEGWVRETGFDNVNVIKSLLPIGQRSCEYHSGEVVCADEWCSEGTWPKDKRMKTIGAYNFAQLWEGLDGFSPRLFINMLEWSREKMEVLLMECREDLKDPRVHPMMDLYVVLVPDSRMMFDNRTHYCARYTVWAQKPLS
jgi:SAM-dependent methyltransferase